MHRRDWLGWIVGLAALILYSYTSAPGIVELFDDSLEFQVVGPTFGISHPTGYPLYIIVSGVWSRLLFPVGNWAWRMNLLSAIFAACTVALTFLLARRLIVRADGRPDSLAALAAATAFALSPVWWQQATVAEVYTLHGLFVISLLYLAVRLAHQTVYPAGAPQRPGISSQPRKLTIVEWPLLDRRIALLCFVVGLALTHHRTTVLLLPLLAIYLLWAIPGLWRPRRVWVYWFVLICLPLTLYLYLPLRAGMGVQDLHGSYVNSWRGFLDHVLARGYLSFFGENTLGAGRSWPEWIALGIQQFGMAGAVLAILGLLGMWHCTRRLLTDWILVLAMFVVTVAFALFYRVPDPEVFLIPAFLCAAIFVGGSIGFVRRVLARWPNWSIGVQIFLLLCILLGIGGRFPHLINRRQDTWAHAYAYLMASVPFPPDSAVVGLEGEITALRYMKLSRNLAQGVKGYIVDDPSTRLEQIKTLVRAGVPTYVTRELDGLEPLYSFTGDGPLIRVAARGSATHPPPQFELKGDLIAGALQLTGYDLQRMRVPPGTDILALSLHWLPVQEIDTVLKVSLRLLHEDGRPLVDDDGIPLFYDRYPLRRVARTPTWLPGVPVKDVHYLFLPDAGDAEQLLLIVYDEESTAEYARITIDLSGAIRDETSPQD